MQTVCQIARRHIPPKYYSAYDFFLGHCRSHSKHTFCVALFVVANATCDSEAGAWRSIRFLLREGWIKKVAGERGDGRTPRYRLIEHAEWLTEHAHLVEPCPSYAVTPKPQISPVQFQISPVKSQIAPVGTYKLEKLEKPEKLEKEVEEGRANVARDFSSAPKTSDAVKPAQPTPELEALLCSINTVFGSSPSIWPISKDDKQRLAKLEIDVREETGNWADIIQRFVAFAGAEDEDADNPLALFLHKFNSLSREKLTPADAERVFQFFSKKTRTTLYDDAVRAYLTGAPVPED